MKKLNNVFNHRTSISYLLDVDIRYDIRYKDERAYFDLYDKFNSKLFEKCDRIKRLSYADIVPKNLPSR